MPVGLRDFLYSSFYLVLIGHVGRSMGFAYHFYCLLVCELIFRIITSCDSNLCRGPDYTFIFHSLCLQVPDNIPFLHHGVLFFNWNRDVAQEPRPYIWSFNISFLLWSITGEQGQCQLPPFVAQPPWVWARPSNTVPILLSPAFFCPFEVAFHDSERKNFHLKRSTSSSSYGPLTCKGLGLFLLLTLHSSNGI